MVNVDPPVRRESPNCTSASTCMWNNQRWSRFCAVTGMISISRMESASLPLEMFDDDRRVARAVIVAPGVFVITEPESS